ncbi:hypothetical protein MCEMSEM23_00236 [Rhabdaerophilaceae bacterium]
MSPASLLAEALRHQEPLNIARERLSSAAHVATHYRAIRLPALAATTTRIAQSRRQGLPSQQANAATSSD